MQKPLNYTHLGIKTSDCIFTCCSEPMPRIEIPSNTARAFCSERSCLRLKKKWKKLQILRFIFFYKTVPDDKYDIILPQWPTVGWTYIFGHSVCWPFSCNMAHQEMLAWFRLGKISETIILVTVIVIIFSSSCFVNRLLLPRPLIIMNQNDSKSTSYMYMAGHHHDHKNHQHQYQSQQSPSQTCRCFLC